MDNLCGNYGRENMYCCAFNSRSFDIQLAPLNIHIKADLISGHSQVNKNEAKILRFL